MTRRLFKNSKVVIALVLMTVFASAQPGLHGQELARTGSIGNVSASAQLIQRKAGRMSATNTAGGEILYRSGNGILGRIPTESEALEMSVGRNLQSLHAITHEGIRPQATTGLQITLRSTAQLDAFPDAKAAFIKAASQWEQLIQSNISVIIDVDFGPTRFGKAYEEDVLGSTGSQEIGASDIYPDIRTQLIASASPQDATLLGQLPETNLVTDIGPTQAVYSPSALWRALGMINAAADPAAEKPDFGDPPSIGFNSAFDFDYNPDDGIGAGKYDFVAIAMHEIGHVLGFDTMVGYRELRSTVPVAVSVWDLFRFHPPVYASSFNTQPRILSSGGDQVFFGGSMLPLSTGRPDGSGGDGNQACHWKEKDFVGQRIGLMDPRIGEGEHVVVTDNDLTALRLMGYKVGTSSNPGEGDNPPVVESTTAHLEGNALVLTGMLSDPNADIKNLVVKVMDSTGTVLGSLTSSPEGIGGKTSLSYQLTITGMEDFLSAVKGTIYAEDNAGNKSGSYNFSFNQADQGAPTLKSVLYDPAFTTLVIKGNGLNRFDLVEVNGLIVTPPLKSKLKGVAKLKTTGTAAQFGLKTGPNRIRVQYNSSYSNILILNR